MYLLRVNDSGSKLQTSETAQSGLAAAAVRTVQECHYQPRAYRARHQHSRTAAKANRSLQQRFAFYQRVRKL